jgi:hypothetical protein
MSWRFSGEISIVGASVGACSAGAAFAGGALAEGFSAGIPGIPGMDPDFSWAWTVADWAEPTTTLLNKPDFEK